MKAVFNFFCLFLLYTFCVSCSTSADMDIIQPEEPSASVEIADKSIYQSRSIFVEENNIDEPEEDENIPKILKFTYKGIAYESVYSFDSDKNMIVSDEKASKMVDRIKQIPTLSTIVHADGSLHFFDTYDEQVSYSNKAVITKAAVFPGYYIKNIRLRIWQRAKGRTRGGLAHEWETANQSNVSPPAFYQSQLETVPDADDSLDDMVSSMEMWAEKAPYPGGLADELFVVGQYNNAVVTFFENKNYGGRSLTFYEVTTDYTYTHRDYFSSFYFDNITSSIKIIYQDIN